MLDINSLQIAQVATAKRTWKMRLPGKMHGYLSPPGKLCGEFAPQLISQELFA